MDPLKTLDAEPGSRWGDLVRPALLAPAALVVLGTWLTAADSLMTVTMMPTVAHEIGGYAWLGWAVAAFALGSILAGATAGWMSARLGLRGALLLGAGAYAIGCSIGACAPDVTSFMLGRGLQGVGGGWVMGLCYVAVTALFPEKLWSRMLSALAGVWGAATLTSPLIGGLFAQSGHWRFGFWLFAAQGLIFSLAVAALVPRAVKGESDAGRVPWAPLAFLSTGVVMVSAAGVVQGGVAPFVLSVGGLLSLALFLRADASPFGGLLPKRASDLRSGEGAGLFAMVCFTLSTVSFTVYGPALMQSLHGASPVAAGYTIVCEAVGWTIASLSVAGAKPERRGLWIRVGSCLIAAGLIFIAFAVPYGALGLVAACAYVQGTGFGLIWAFASGRIVGAAPESERAAASSAIPTTQLIGNAIGASLAALIANSLGLASGAEAHAPVRHGEWIFLAFLPVALLGVAASWRLASPQFQRDS